MTCSSMETIGLPEQPAPDSSSQEGSKWWQLLQTGLSSPAMKSSEEGSQQPLETSHAVSSVIEAALQAALSDNQWSSSGIPELLRKALRQGSCAVQRKQALALLDFHFLVEKYRNVVSKSTSKSSGSSGSGNSGSRQEDGNSLGTEVQSPAKRIRELPPHDGEPTCMSLPAAPAPISISQGTFALPAKPAPRVNGVSAMLSTPSAAGVFAKSTPAASGSVRTPGSSISVPNPMGIKRSREVRIAQDPIEWQGRVAQTVHGKDVLYCDGLRIGLPFEHAADVPAAGLEVTHIAPRRGIKLGEHSICRCTLPTALSRSQTAKLKQLASHELVLVAPLEEHGLILVPYTNNTGELRMVAFFVIVQ